MGAPYHSLLCEEDNCEPGCAVLRAQGRDPDLAEPVAGQIDLLKLLEEAGT